MVKTGNKWRYPEYSADKAQAHIREGQANMGNLLNLPIGNIVMDWDGKTPSTKVDEEIVRLSVPRKWSDDGPFEALRVTDILFDTKSLVIKAGMSSYVYPTIEAGAFAMTNTIFKAVGKASDKKAMVVPAHVNNDEGCMEMTYFWDAADGRKTELLVRGYDNHAGQFALCSLLHTKGDGIMPKMQPRQNSDGNNTYEERNMTGDAGIQKDNLIEELKRTDALLEYAVMHGDDAEAERLRKLIREITERI